MKELLINLIQCDDRDLLTSIKEFDVDIVVESVLDNYDNEDIDFNILLWEAIKRHCDIILTSRKYEIIYEYIHIDSITYFDDYLKIYCNYLNTKVKFDLNKFLEDHECDNVKDLLTDLTNDLENFKN